VNIVTAKEVVLTAKHVALIMEFAAGGNMTAYVAKKSQSSADAAQGQLFMTEDEARYFYRVRPSNLLACCWTTARALCHPSSAEGALCLCGCAERCAPLSTATSSQTGLWSARYQATAGCTSRQLCSKARQLIPGHDVVCGLAVTACLADAAFVDSVQQFIRAVDFCHRNNVAHRYDHPS